MLSKSPSRWVESISVAVQPTKADLLLVGNFLKTQVVERTERGVDADGKAFAPYSENGPYYYNPSGRVGSAFARVAVRKGMGQEDIAQGIKDIRSLTAKRQKAAASRLLKKLGGPGSGGVKSRTGVSIKFASYGAFKRALGRAGVDLTGPRAPHMMQALTVRAESDGVVIGIYGEPAGRAQGHQYGNPRRKLPQRKFLGATPEDRREIIKLLHAQVQGRIKRK